MTETMVRAAVAADLDGVVELLVNLAREEGREPAARETLRLLLAACLDSHCHQLHVAEGAGRVVGYVVAHWVPFPLMGGREAYVSDLVVAADRRGGRVGSRLLTAVEEAAVEGRCARVMLNNRVGSQAYERAFYAKRGYRRRDEFANFVKEFG